MIVALGAASFAAATSADSAPSPLYTVAATQACLVSLPGAIPGLPPATPPSPPATFVHRFSTDPFRPQVRAQLGAWYGHRMMRGYVGVTFSFFRSIPAARAYANRFNLTAGRRTRNVIVEWDDASGREARWRNAVQSCLRTGPSVSSTPGRTQPTPQASRGTFAGYWGGHTRHLWITAGGRGLEITNSGCCHRAYRMTFQILSVSGTLTRARAVYRVKAFTRYDRTVPELQRDRIGRLLLRNGIVTNTLTRVFFCSEPAWAATGACGA